MRKILTGVVTGDKTAKTRRVEVERLYRHPKYGKIVKARTVCHVHDENNESLQGDSVEIAECRPRSALKRWELVRVLKKANPLSAEASRDEEVVENATA
jgi:small subunit ribosomal protein S17